MFIRNRAKGDGPAVSARTSIWPSVARLVISTRPERCSLLARRLKPFIQRQTKAEVAAELPEKTEITSRIELADDQRDLY